MVKKIKNKIKNKNNSIKPRYIINVIIQNSLGKVYIQESTRVSSYNLCQSRKFLLLRRAGERERGKGREGGRGAEAPFYHLSFLPLPLVSNPSAFLYVKGEKLAPRISSAKNCRCSIFDLFFFAIICYWIRSARRFFPFGFYGSGIDYKDCGRIFSVEPFPRIYYRQVELWLLKSCRGIVS